MSVDATEARCRAIKLLAEPGIQAAEQRIEHFSHQFSGGMRLGIVITLALAAEPS